jgi:hypothetical protein
MSLFSRLLSLHTDKIPLEDFFTELVAYLFSTDKTILYIWLKHLNVLNINDDLDAHISTQQTFKPLDYHRSGSRPDILIEVISNEWHNLFFIESKIGSQEGNDQLSKYAEILHELPGFQNKFLVYITRDFDPKDEKTILRSIPNSNVQFKQYRWHQFYQFLKTQPPTMLIREMIMFMHEHHMAQNNQFSSVDIIALANFTRSLKLMEETMWGEVSQRFKEILGAIKPKVTALTQVQNHGRYLITASMPNGKWWCGLGFILKTANLADYPTVRLMLEVDPNSQHRTEILEAMWKICQQYGWQGYDLNNAKAWSGIAREKSLQNFLSEEDHIVAIERFFLQALDELAAIKHQYSNLPWGAIQDDVES